MWFILALISAVCLGFYDVFKKISLRDNAVLPVLLLNTLIGSLLFLPLIISSYAGLLLPDSHWFVPSATVETHLWVVLKAIIVLSSWICGYFAMKHLPITLVGPINATRPVMTLLGAMLVFQEQFNLWQWTGVALAIFSFFLMSRSGRKEGVNFFHNRWILLLVLAAVLGACSGLYDKFLLRSPSLGGIGLNPIFVQSWFNVYQFGLMTLIFAFLWWPIRKSTTVFQWRWSILGISIFLALADLVYFYALTEPDVLIAIVSMTRRSSVLVSFLFGAFLWRENNIRAKAFDLLLVFISLIFLCIGALQS
ncbi:MAG: DMT family transporter [Alloprevotella sp.]|nr:DMT family transporter [Alloprevotella sp.]